ncbi:MAG: hypothetical protein ACJAQT_003144 [Akkermansiaceae bacterium]|jgi:hypothetical protein
MREFFCFEVDDDEAFQDIMIEDQIKKEVGGLGADPHLADDEGKAVPHFEQELLELGDDG